MLLVGPNALAATHLLFNHAADVVLRRLRLIPTATLFLFRRRTSLSGDYFNFIDYNCHLRLLLGISHAAAQRRNAIPWN